MTWQLIIDYFSVEHYFFHSRENAVQFAKQFFEDHRSDYIWCDSFEEACGDFDGDLFILQELKYMD